jgi:hypothetical protein
LIATFFGTDELNTPLLPNFRCQVAQFFAWEPTQNRYDYDIVVTVLNKHEGIGRFFSFFLWTFTANL